MFNFLHPVKYKCALDTVNAAGRRRHPADGKSASQINGLVGPVGVRDW